jgi:L-alanine-DL-glutamate epimerase-like enolase superfamily enzyme
MRIKEAGFDLIWMEDPILRDDFDGLKALRASVSWTQINSGEYLDLSGRRSLLQAGGTDILNVHGRVSDVMRIGWLAADMGIPVSLGNTFLETGVHTACALPEVDWMEYSFLNYDHLVDSPVEIRDGLALGSDRPGMGFALSEEARKQWSAPEVIADEDLKAGPPCRFL